MKSKSVSRIKFGLSRIVVLFMTAAMLTLGFASCSSDSGDGGNEAKTYSVKVEKAEHGTVVVSAEKAEAGKTITLEAKAEDGYVFEAYTVKDADGKSVEVKDGAFKMPASDVIVSVSFKEKETTPDTPTDTTKPADSTANKAAADAVTAKINAIGTVTYTAECKEKIDAARTAYNALTEAQKALVSAETLAVLTNAETTYASLFPFPFKSFTIPAAGISKSGATIIATIKADNFANLNIDFSKFTASCSADPSITTGTAFTKVSDTEIQATFKIPGTAGEYSITVSYGSNSKTGTLKVQDYKVGDVLMNDGTIERYSATPSFTDEQKSKAVGVTYALNEYGAPAGWLGLYNSVSGTNSDYYMWAKRGTAGFSTKFTDIICRPSQDGSGAADTATFDDDTDGSDNWAKICSQDSTASENAAENYPAFNYVNNYAANFGLSGTYAAGWYMPSIAELAYIYRNRTTLNTVLEALGGTQLASAYYWSSSQGHDYSNKARYLDFSDGTLYSGRKDGLLRVCCVRAFSN